MCYEFLRIILSKNKPQIQYVLFRWGSETILNSWNYEVCAGYKGGIISYLFDTGRKKKKYISSFTFTFSCAVMLNEDILFLARVSILEFATTLSCSTHYISDFQTLCWQS